MIAEFLSVGTELLLGEIVDTNSAYLAQELAKRGVDVYWSRRVGDNLDRIEQAVAEALGRSDVLFMCGGLGPTDDDMTREAISAYLGEQPRVDPQLEAELREKFALFSRHMPENNLKQAWLIPSAEALANPRGTAPGWFVRTERDGKPKCIVALPGPPWELERMFHKEVLPRLTLPTSVFFSRTFKTQGIGESTLAERLGDLTLAANPSVATYAKRDGVHVRVAAKADSEGQALALAQPALEKVQAALNEFVWGYDDEELADKVLLELNKHELSIALSEVSTGGFLSNLLSGVSNPLSSNAFRGALVNNHVQAQAPTDPQAEASSMAQTACDTFGSEVGLATSKVQENADGSGVVYIACVSSHHSELTEHRLLRLHTDWVKERVAFAALQTCLNHLSQISQGVSQGLPDEG